MGTFMQGINKVVILGAGAMGAFFVSRYLAVAGY